MHFYSSHLNDEVYWRGEPVEDEYLRCEICGDDDRYLGEAFSAHELSEMLKDNDYNFGYIKEVVRKVYGVADG